MNVFVPACYIRMYVDTEADLGGGPGVRTPPPLSFQTCMKPRDLCCA